MTTITRRLSAIPITHPATILTVAWVFSMISLPIARWVIGDRVIPFAVLVSALLQASAVFVILLDRWGTRRTLISFAIVAVVTWGAEFIGSTTGIPFGEYHYTLLLQPQIGGVPLLIPVAWFMMLGPAWAVAYAILRGDVSGQRRLLFIALSALALTAWDLFLDPQMVGWGFWEWANPFGYFGIPWVNYLGWLIVSALVTVLVRTDDLPVRSLLAIYGIVWFLQSVGLAVFWGQPGPAFFGFIGMGGFLLLSIRAILSDPQADS